MLFLRLFIGETTVSWDMNYAGRLFTRVRFFSFINGFIALIQFIAIIMNQLRFYLNFKTYSLE
jgi:hypothetical protein